MRDTKDSQFLSDTSNRESLANHLDKRGPLGHHDVSSLDDLLRETAGWHGEIAVMY